MTESEQEITLGSYLRSQREIAELSIRELARLSGVPASYITEIEGGKKTHPSAEILQKLATVLELDTADLFAFIGVIAPQGLPSVAPYLRAKYKLSGDALREAEQQLTRIIEQHN
ncbi:helix-turn-helix domain-containing protein [Protofrankia symbiont of Coriaria ruscifolia]|uniref:helix-turn-helix domain-containing protein n=1 Tax=Protofrankia symbiont of Coriaria ruscifolia TaxID=1306542 RepID=UPI0013EF5F6F|nr:helix-turn-helix transcriptional regulator [Protofrankia symbiont of Coriaria ruscifolia]